MSKLITKEQAEQLDDRYVNTRTSILETALGHEDSRNFYYSIEDMKKFIKHVEDESNANGYENIGVRIFLGAYPANEDGNTLSTLFLTATRDNGLVNSKEIEPMNFAGPGRKKY